MHIKISDTHMSI